MYFSYFVSSRLLDMGFEKDVSQILTAIKQQKGNLRNDDVPSRYQSILLSATLSTDVKRLASVALVEPVTVDVAVNMDSLSNQDTVCFENKFNSSSNLLPIARQIRPSE